MSIAVLLILLLSIDIYNYVYWFLSVSIIFLLLIYFLDNRIDFNLLTILVIGFILLLILNMIFIRPVRNAEAEYLIWLFASGFILCTYADEIFVKYVFFTLIGIFLLLSIWGIIQYTTGAAYLIEMGHRANAIFITPNTFAASINMILLPAIVIYVLIDRNNKVLFSSLLILFFALLVTQSRGGWIAFTCSIIIIYILMRVLSIEYKNVRLKNLALGLTLIFTIYSGMSLIEYDKFKDKNSIRESISHLTRSDSASSVMLHRFELYDVAWRKIKQKPLLGYGLHTYQYYKSHDHKASYTTNVTRFAHNDYLQLWMETGVAGIILFIMLFIISIYFLVGLINKVSNREKIIMLAVIAGLLSFYVHALVDFVFYIPFVLLMFSCSFGLCNQIVNKYYKRTYVLNLSSIMIRFSFVKFLILSIVICLLSQPTIAQLAYDEAVRRIYRLDIDGALPLYEVARRFAPYEPDYYWYEGAVLMNAVKLEQHQLSAVRADELFAKGMIESPYAVNNRLARAELHRDYGHLLSTPESLNNILKWNEEALNWRPNDPVIRAEYYKTLIAMGDYNMVNFLLNDFILQFPDSKEVVEIKEILEIMDKINL
jgi:O-antigen ligase